MSTKSRTVPTVLRIPADARERLIAMATVRGQTFTATMVDAIHSLYSSLPRADQTLVSEITARRLTGR